MASFNLAELSELLFIELGKIGRRYLQVLEIYSCANIGGCNMILISLIIASHFVRMPHDINKHDLASLQSATAHFRFVQ